MKRALALLPFALLVGCGPSTPAESPAPAAPISTSTAPAPAAAAEVKPVETVAPDATARAEDEAKPAPPPPPAPPQLTGTLGGKEFKAKSAITLGPLSQGRVVIMVADYDTACGKPYDATAGDRTVTLQIEWKQGEVAFAGGKGQIPPSYIVTTAPNAKVKPTALGSKGKVELAAAPTEVGKSTRLKIDLTSGKDTLKGDIELFVCKEIKEEAKR